MRTARPEPRRRWPARVWAALALAAFVVGVGLQGQSYIACTVMQSLHWAACCPGPEHDDDDHGGAPAAQSAGCCVERSFAALGSSERAPRVEGPSGLAVVAVWPLAAAAPVVTSTAGAAPGVPHSPRLSRAGPAPPRPIAERLARLGRLLC